MFGCKEKKKLKEICTTLELTSGGIYKRIDENRELLEFLAEESPEILQKKSLGSGLDTKHWRISIGDIAQHGDDPA